MSIHDSPTDQWFNSAIGEARSEGIGRVLEGSMATSLARIRQTAPEVDREWKAGWWRASTRTIRCAMTKPKGTTTDEGMKHWFDERGICRSRYLKGTNLCTTFATISCTTRRSGFFLGMIRRKGEDEMSDLVCRLVDKCDDLGIRLGLVMLDRGFYTTGVIHSLKEIRAEKKKPDPFDCLVLCRRTKRVKDTLDECAERGAVASEEVITGKASKYGGKPASVSYCTHTARSKACEVAGRRNKRKRTAEKRPHEQVRPEDARDAARLRSGHSSRMQVRRVCLQHAKHGRVQVRGAADELDQVPRPREANAVRVARLRPQGTCASRQSCTTL